MVTLTLSRPGPRWGELPERNPSDPTGDNWLPSGVRSAGGRRSATLLAAIHASRQQLQRLSDAEQQTLSQSLARRIRAEGLTDALRYEAIALVTLYIRQILDIDLHDEQLIAAMFLLDGSVVEMQTGEGKTLVALTGACIAALAGTPVHVITTNDYLAARDAAQAQVVADLLGLTVGCARSTDVESERRAAYACDIAYVTNKQIVFDYLRDRQHNPTPPGSLRRRLGELVNGPSTPSLLRGLCFAIVDEADSVFIDDARTPLILSQPQRPAIPSTNCAVALGLAKRLAAEQDFRTDVRRRGISLTDTGRDRIAEMTQSLRGNWASERYRDELVTQALAALNLYQRDRHYLVSDGGIVLIDETTGRAATDRKLSHGVHQMLEIKEGCAASAALETISSISTGGFFRRYHHLAGMTGTACEVASELNSVFGLGVRRIPLHRASVRKSLGRALLSSSLAKRERIVERVQQVHDEGRPILLGTRTVAESETISVLLSTHGLEHLVLNATQDRHEAEIVARAGEAGSIVVATNMAGRGTDIPLGAGVAAAGGLHVICTELNDSRRIDRQLIGRCARQGDPGSFEYVLSLEDELLTEFYPERTRRLLARCSSAFPRLWLAATPWLCRLPQWWRERQHRQARRAVLKKDERLESLLAFSGPAR